MELYLFWGFRESRASEIETSEVPAATALQELRLLFAEVVTS